MKRAGLLLLPVIGLACNTELVGGDCLEGYVQKGHQCVEAPVKSSSNGSGGADTSMGGANSSGTSEPSSGSGQPTTSGDASTGQGGSGGCGALTVCGEGCIDTHDNPAHCGDCGNVCPSGICVAGECQGAVAGHVVVLGIDFVGVGDQTAAARLLGNSVFLSTHAPVRVLDYRVSSDANAATHVQDLLTSEAASRARTMVVSVAPAASSVAQSLATSDVFVLHVPGELTKSGVTNLASAWSSPLQLFEKNGGVVVVLVQTNAPQAVSSLLDQCGLMPGVSGTQVASAPYAIDDFLDSVTAGVLTPFATPQLGVALDYPGQPSSTMSIPVVDGAGIPVALHRVIPPNGP